MRIDSTLIFSSAQSLVAGAGIAVPSTVIDLLGLGAGVAPTNIFGLTATVFGADMGVGGGFVNPTLQIAIGTAFATATAATLNIQFQAAADQGAAGLYQPSTWNTLMETGAMAVANLTAGAVIARMDWPPVFPATLRPRFVRLNYVMAAATNFTAGTIAFAGVVPIRDDYSAAQAAANFVVA